MSGTSLYLLTMRTVVHHAAPAGVVDPPEPEERLVLGLTFSDIYYYLNIAYWWAAGRRAACLLARLLARLFGSQVCPTVMKLATLTGSRRAPAAGASIISERGGPKAGQAFGATELLLLGRAAAPEPAAAPHFPYRNKRHRPPALPAQVAAAGVGADRQRPGVAHRAL